MSHDVKRDRRVPLDGAVNFRDLGGYIGAGGRQVRWGRVFRALVSHAWKWWRGEAHDPEDGQHHLASVVWCALTLMEYEIRGAGEDDRVPYPASTRRACPRDPREPSSPGASPGDPDPDPPPSRDPRQLELALPPLHTPTRAR